MADFGPPKTGTRPLQAIVHAAVSTLKAFKVPSNDKFCIRDVNGDMLPGIPVNVLPVTTLVLPMPMDILPITMRVLLKTMHMCMP